MERKNDISQKFSMEKYKLISGYLNAVRSYWNIYGCFLHINTEKWPTKRVLILFTSGVFRFIYNVKYQTKSSFLIRIYRVYFHHFI